mmetsp:Transcript_13210/g.49007  ORF Transcript_13210/g.49007 Transcript_13210/m.49007 type:complete len:220 (-) Transcript_13210:1568-2227(-)
MGRKRADPASAVRRRGEGRHARGRARGRIPGPFATTAKGGRAPPDRLSDSGARGGPPSHAAPQGGLHAGRGHARHDLRQRGARASGGKRRGRTGRQHVEEGLPSVHEEGPSRGRGPPGDDPAPRRGAGRRPAKAPEVSHRPLQGGGRAIDLQRVGGPADRRRSQGRTRLGVLHQVRAAAGQRKQAQAGRAGSGVLRNAPPRRQRAPSAKRRGRWRLEGH